MKFNFFTSVTPETAFLETILAKKDYELWNYRQDLLLKAPQILMNCLHYERSISKNLRNAIIERLASLQAVSPEKRQEKPSLLISDIDNTFLSSRDPRYESNSTPYPGIKELYKALLHGNSNDDLPLRRKASLCAFLTARPGQPLFKHFRPLSSKMKKITSDALRLAGIALEKQLILWGDFLHCLPQPGSMYKSLGKGKIANFDKFSKLYADYQFIFFGDNGEADIDVARAMLRSAGAAMSAIFIHDLKNLSPDEIKQFAAEGIFIYKSIIDAALIALTKELISHEQALDIARAVVNETDNSHTSSDDKAITAFNRRIEAISLDLQRLHQQLADPEIIELIKRINKKHLLPPSLSSDLSYS
ncbi:hypothetical protein [Legionella sp. km772]|uniref:hypothetical protein n=1 Tax=Legionella sp. km772 TaxID=2498111 RepID=UPI000F8E57EE|nr:hypothetical protein [Legionella sp. km772]RUR13123.1 hypothetical protein ELY15_03215 [Legionella sp. km772]